MDDLGVPPHLWKPPGGEKIGLHNTHMLHVWNIYLHLGDF